MTREERAKQFMAFDAMKGLKEALEDREERHLRVNRHEITKEQQEKNSQILLSLKKYDTVSVFCYLNFHDVTVKGRLTEINLPFKFIKVDDTVIKIEDIYFVDKYNKEND